MNYKSTNWNVFRNSICYVSIDWNKFLTYWFDFTCSRKLIFLFYLQIENSKRFSNTTVLCIKILLCCLIYFFNSFGKSLRSSFKGCISLLLESQLPLFLDGVNLCTYYLDDFVAICFLYCWLLLIKVTNKVFLQ